MDKKFVIQVLGDVSLNLLQGLNALKQILEELSVSAKKAGQMDFSKGLGKAIDGLNKMATGSKKAISDVAIAIDDYAGKTEKALGRKNKAVEKFADAEALADGKARKAIEELVQAEIERVKAFDTGGSDEERQRRTQKLVRSIVALYQSLADLKQLGKIRTVEDLAKKMDLLKVSAGMADGSIRATANGFKLASPELAKYLGLTRKQAAVLKYSTDHTKEQTMALQKLAKVYGYSESRTKRYENTIREVGQLTKKRKSQILDEIDGLRSLGSQTGKTASKINKLEKEYKDLTRETKLVDQVQRHYKETIAGLSQQQTTLGKKIKTTKKSLGYFGDMVNHVSQRVKSFGAFMAAAFVVRGITRSFHSLFDTLAQFDQILYNLQAILDITRGEAALLGKTILQIARDTKFSAIEIGKGVQTIGQAGFDVQKTMQIVGNVGKLATGTMSGFALVSDLVTTALNAFSLQATESSRVADIFANAVNGSKLTIDKLKTSFNYVGAAGAQVGLTINEVTGTLMELADSGLRASTSGTGFRMMLLKMINPTTLFRAAIADAGLEVKDFNPKIVGYQQALKNLLPLLWDTKTGTVDMGKATAFFGVRASQAAAVIVKSVHEGSNALESAIEKTHEFGSATRMAETQIEGLGLKFKNLKDRIGNVVIALGGGGLTGALTVVIDALRNLTKWLAEAINNNNMVVTLGLITTAVFTFSAAVSGLFPILATLGKMWKGLIKAHASLAFWVGAVTALFTTFLSVLSWAKTKHLEASKAAAEHAAEMQNLAESTENWKKQLDISFATTEWVNNVKRFAQESAKAFNAVQEAFDKIQISQKQKPIKIVDVATIEDLHDLQKAFDNVSTQKFEEAMRSSAISLIEAQKQIEQVYNSVTSFTEKGFHVKKVVNTIEELNSILKKLAKEGGEEGKKAVNQFEDAMDSLAKSTIKMAYSSGGSFKDVIISVQEVKKQFEGAKSGWTKFSEKIFGTIPSVNLAFEKFIDNITKIQFGPGFVELGRQIAYLRKEMLELDKEGASFAKNKRMEELETQLGGLISFQGKVKSVFEEVICGAKTMKEALKELHPVFVGNEKDWNNFVKAMMRTTSEMEIFTSDLYSIFLSSLKKIGVEAEKLFKSLDLEKQMNFYQNLPQVEKDAEEFRKYLKSTGMAIDEVDKRVEAFVKKKSMERLYSLSDKEMKKEEEKIKEHSTVVQKEVNKEIEIRKKGVKEISKIRLSSNYLIDDYSDTRKIKAIKRDIEMAVRTEKEGAEEIFKITVDLLKRTVALKKDGLKQAKEIYGKDSVEYRKASLEKEKAEDALNDFLRDKGNERLNAIRVNHEAQLKMFAHLKDEIQKYYNDIDQMVLDNVLTVEEAERKKRAVSLEELKKREQEAKGYHQKLLEENKSWLRKILDLFSGADTPKEKGKSWWEKRKEQAAAFWKWLMESQEVSEKELNDSERKWQSIREERIKTETAQKKQAYKEMLSAFEQYTKAKKQIYLLEQGRQDVLVYTGVLTEEEALRIKTQNTQEHYQEIVKLAEDAYRETIKIYPLDTKAAMNALLKKQAAQIEYNNWLIAEEKKKDEKIAALLSAGHSLSEDLLKNEMEYWEQRKNLNSANIKEMMEEENETINKKLKEQLAIIKENEKKRRDESGHTQNIIKKQVGNISWEVRKAMEGASDSIVGSFHDASTGMQKFFDFASVDASLIERVYMQASSEGRKQFDLMLQKMAEMSDQRVKEKGEILLTQEQITAAYTKAYEERIAKARAFMEERISMVKASHDKELENLRKNLNEGKISWEHYSKAVEELEADTVKHTLAIWETYYNAQTNLLKQYEDEHEATLKRIMDLKRQLLDMDKSYAEKVRSLLRSRLTEEGKVFDTRKAWKKSYEELIKLAEDFDKKTPEEQKKAWDEIIKKQKEVDSLTDELPNKYGETGHEIDLVGEKIEKLNQTQILIKEVAEEYNTNLSKISEAEDTRIKKTEDLLTETQLLIKAFKDSIALNIDHQKVLEAITKLSDVQTALDAIDRNKTKIKINTSQIDTAIKKVKELIKKLNEANRKKIGGGSTGGLAYGKTGGVFTEMVSFLAGGGRLPGFGGGDIVNARLEPGEYVVRKEQVKKLGVGLFDWLNSLGTNISDIWGKIGFDFSDWMSPLIKPQTHFKEGGLATAPANLGSLNLSINNEAVGTIYAEPDVLNILSKQVKKQNRLRRQ